MSDDISNKLLKIRQNMGFSQEEIAERLGVSFATVNRWENGHSLPRKSIRLAVESLYQESQDISISSKQRDVIRRKRRGGGFLDTSSMEKMLWKAACSIRGEKDAPKFKDYILPLLFIKRLSDVFEDELDRLSHKFGDKKSALKMLELDHSLVRFYLPPETRWEVVWGRKKFNWSKAEQPRSLGEQLTITMRKIVKANPNKSLQGVIDAVDYNESKGGEREISDKALRGVMNVFSDSKYRLGLKDVEPDFLGRAYEYLLRKFAEGQGQSAGEFFTPREVGFIMANILHPQGGEIAYDYACGSFGLLIKLHLVLKKTDPLNDSPLKLYGQELTSSSFAIACMNRIIHDMKGEGQVQRGNSMENPKFKEPNGQLKKFDIITANPMWNQPFDSSIYENDPFDRFESQGGVTSGKGDWAWLQHTLACLKDNGRATVVLDTGAVTRGSGSHHEDKEKKIRKWFVDHDFIEGVILLPSNLFYNTSSAGIIIVLNKKKIEKRKNKIILLNASQEFYKGKPKNHISEESVDKISKAFIKGENRDRFLKVITKEEAKRNDYNLSPARYISLSEEEVYRPIPNILSELKVLKKEEEKVEKNLDQIFKKLKS